jgi:hypothetical protein
MFQGLVHAAVQMVYLKGWVCTTFCYKVGKPTSDTHQMKLTTHFESKQYAECKLFKCFSKFKNRFMSTENEDRSGHKSMNRTNENAAAELTMFVS